MEEEVGAGVEEDGGVDLRGRHGRRRTAAARAEEHGGAGGGAQRPRGRRRTMARAEDDGDAIRQPGGVLSLQREKWLSS